VATLKDSPDLSKVPHGQPNAFRTPPACLLPTIGLI
jgi:hypothetical protein